MKQQNSFEGNEQSSEIRLLVEHDRRRTATRAIDFDWLSLVFVKAAGCHSVDARAGLAHHVEESRVTHWCACVFDT
jgi:hypothetical protein